MNKGTFITFEGGEGVGKSTHIDLLANRFREKNYQVLQTREPGGTRLSESIRNLLQHDSDGENMCEETEALLFAASRAQLVNERIIPSLENNEIVLCDRYIDSTATYQGLGRSLGSEYVQQAIYLATRGLKPNLTFLIDCDPEVGMNAIRSRSGGKLDRIEKENRDFFSRVRKGFLDIAHAEPERFSIVPYIHGDFQTMQDYMRQEIKDRLDIMLF